ncbi:MAG: glutamine--fructose-6-phosphate transaminase (isomerizing) [Caulobacterales bacterium 32-69-10]|nr:MAG: glutamine--fructose-6-phosphate transaminase (isomerizing) [Caulobacterales bacterium 32-69-10]
MCGIIGIVGIRPVADRLLESLKRLEYRGYDSAGIATLDAGRLDRRRAKGKIRALEERLAQEPIGGSVGIGHTRWATHGVPAERNAHPHRAGRVAVVHNGIIENFAALKAGLVAAGHSFESETDTEVIAHLLDEALESGAEPLAAFKATLDKLEGAYALAVLVEGRDALVMGARRGSPLVVGYGEGEMFIGSDALAVGPFTQSVAYLDEGDYVAIDHAGAQVFDATGAAVRRARHQVAASAALVEKGNYRHFMEKEIHEQPDAIQHTLSAYLDPVTGRASAPDGFDFAAIPRIQIVACGTAYFAGLTAKYLFERLAGLPVDVEIASEFRYREPAVVPGTLALAISQSGETADTLAALRWCKAQGLPTAAVVNSHQSSMAREADRMWPTHAGPEIGHARGRIDDAATARLVQVLMEAPRLIAETLQREDAIRALSGDLSRARDVLYLGRGPFYPIALEGALKLKELSYIHAEGYAAGELKHGPLALVDEHMPVVVIAPSGELLEKTLSNLQEVAARGGSPIILITDEGGGASAHAANKVVLVPPCDPIIAPMVYAVPIQLLAYHTAVQKGTDVDQPRNLAKSVTVE